MIKLLDNVKQEEKEEMIDNNMEQENSVKTLAKPIKILYFDGQIDPTWIDYLNLLSGQDKNYCMPNGDIIDTQNYKVIFETQNLYYCTPSFITKHFVVNFDHQAVTQENVLYHWLSRNELIQKSPELKNYIRGLFENYFPRIFDFIQINKLQAFNFSENYVMKNLISLFESILPQFDFEEKKLGRKNANTVTKIDSIKKSTLSIFIFACAWTISFFSNFILKNKVEKLISDTFKPDDLKGPIFDYYIEEERHDFELWNTLFESKAALHQGDSLYIPNIEDLSYQWICGKYFANHKPIFYSGKAVIGKSLVINTILNQLDVIIVSLNFRNIRQK